MSRLSLACGVLLLTAGAAFGQANPFAEWTGHRNRLLPDPPPTVRQDFGYSATRHAGGEAPGEIGGYVQRSAAPAWYAVPVTPKTFGDRLTARGKFAARDVAKSSGALVGWFNSKTTKGWRAADTIAFRVDGNGDKYWVFFEYGTASLRAGGKGCFEGEAYQRTKTKPFRGDGTVHDWELTYDPAGDGKITFNLDGTAYTLPLAPGHKADGATFDRFGMYNHQTTGKGMELYVGDLSLDGKPVDLSSDPKWNSNGNRDEYRAKFSRPRHSFGIDEAGQSVGGVVWRHPDPAYFAAPVGRLTLDDRLEASGTILLTTAMSDSGATFGWFDTESLLKPPAGKTPPVIANRLGILIEGPSRVGHYFRPEYATAAGDRAVRPTGPVIRPDGKPRRWRLAYEPSGADGVGRITFRLGDEEQTFDLTPAHRKAGATFDKFGIYVREQHDGNGVELYLSDLRFTAKPAGK